MRRDNNEPQQDNNEIKATIKIKIQNVRELEGEREHVDERASQPDKTARRGGVRRRGGDDVTQAQSRDAGRLAAS